MKQLDEILTSQEKLILILRFGLDGNPELTLQEVSNYYGVSRERIRQLEAKALRKLRSNPNVAKTFKSYLED
jgi:RNA polymerase primary sigma factor